MTTPCGFGVSHTIPEPREHDGGGFAEAGGDRDELGFARAALVTVGEATLVVVGRVVTGGGLEKVVEGGGHDR